MIGRITGILLEKQAPEIVLDVGGVGYEIQVPMTTLYELPELGGAVTLYTHFVVREDAQLLYGFNQARDRSLFRSLIKVNGVGPRLALTILSGMDADSFVRSVQREDTGTLVKLPGVGKKTAERLLVEMRDKLKGWTEQRDGEPLPAGTAVADRDELAEAESALIALGYRPAEAGRAVMAAAREAGDDSTEELIRRALRSMVSTQ
jgi:Holliday junction DNA helicase RuvA